MNAPDNGRDARSRATRRLRNLTIGTDALAPSMLGIDLACVAAVALSLAWRILPRGTIAPAGTGPRPGGGSGG